MAPRRQAANAAAKAVSAAAAVVDTGDDASIYSPTTENNKKRAGASLKDDKNNEKKKAAKQTEKRAVRYRSTCPQSLRERFTRALSQRMYLISKEEIEYDNNAELPTIWKFTMLGSTGNVYDVMLNHKPSCNCPDHKKRGDLCKHMMFVYCRVIGLAPDNPLAFQKAYLSSELREMYDLMKQRTMRSVWANERVQTQYAAIQNGKSSHDDKEDEAEEQDCEAGVKRRSLDEQDCPICLESMTTCSAKEVTFCKTTCGMNFHSDCMHQWRRAQKNGKLTCPNCRSEAPAADAQPSKPQSEGYVNMGRLQGQSTVRDTSTYHRRRERRRYRYEYHNFSGSEEEEDDDSDYDY